MSDSTEKLRQELQDAQRALAEARARCEHHDAEHQAATKELEENRSALLFMLEDLEAGRKKVEQAHREWMAALDVVDDPIFLHDKQFRILRCNKAYQQRAGIPFHELIGQPYYDVFPKTGAPLSCCLRAMNKAEEEEEEEVAVGEAIYRSRAFSIHDEQGIYLHSVHTLEDITESRRAEAALHESEEKFRKISESAQDAIIMMADKRISFWNAAAERIFGYTAAESLGQELHALIVPSLAYTRFTQAFPHFQASGEGPIIGKVIEVTALRKGGEEFPVELSISATQFGGQWHAIGIVRDITARKRAEERLKRSEARFRSYIELTGQLAWNADAEGKAVEDIPEWRAFTGQSEAQVKGHGWSEAIHPDDRAQVMQIWLEAVGRKGKYEAEIRVRRHDGVYRDFLDRGVPLLDESGQIREWIGTAIDITERKRAEHILKKNEALLNEMGRLAKVGGWEFNVETRDMTWTEEVYRIHELDTTYKPTVDKGIEFYAPASRPIITRVVQRAIEYGDPYDVELEFITAKGNHRWVHANGNVYREHGKTITVFGTFQDITDRKQAEIALNHANRALATLSAVNHTLVRAASEDELFQTICQAIVQQRGYRLAWVGYVQHDESKSIRIIASAGHDEGYLDAMQLTWAEAERGMGPSGRAIRSGVTQLCQDMANDPSYLPWRDAASQRGYASDIALPLTRESGGVFGILHVYSEEMNAFTPAEIALLEETAVDLAFGVNSLHIRRERDRAQDKIQQQLVQLQDSLEDTVRAIASIAEMRDPYTAGHQVRVADLATAIAKQMALPEEQIHAIHLAGVVHDLGKIKVPAEILSKPGKITDLEFGLIKVHPQAGYDILKGIDFPWPIALMVLQHHERLDGSGYPQGLKDGDILIEARILSVADTVEAMSSHRPYRAGLGIEVAMEEIAKNRGIYYDPQVVDACLTLFSEQGYTFK